MRKTVLFIFALCATMMAWGEMTTGPVTYASIAKQNGWAANSYNQTLDWGGPISITAKWEGNTKNGKSIDNSSWRIYQKNFSGEFAINAKPGFVIKTIKLTYANNNKGVCSKVPNADPKTTATASTDQIASKTVYSVNASSITLYVGVSEATTESGDITISLQTIEVTYDYDFADSYLTENFQTPDGTDWNFGTSTSGTTTDGKYYTWEHGNIRYSNQAMDVLQNGVKAVEMRNAPNAYFQTVAEGGVKYISFCWNQVAAEESSYPAEKLILSVGNESETQTIVGQASASRCGDRLFSFFPVTSGKTNATIKLSNLDANRIIFGPITIVPYLRYTYTETQEVNISAGTFDCSAQINNTDGEGSIAYSSSNTDVVRFANAANPEATLVGGGEATITATWSEGASTTFKLTVIMLPEPTVSFADGDAVEKDMNVIGYVNTLTKDGDGEVTYTSSDETVATVSNEGVITIIGEGATTITAMIAACQTYAAAEASYELTITDPKDKAYIETFDKLADDTKASLNDRTGDWYTWKITTGARHKSTDVLYNGTRALWLASNGGIMETTIEGGVKRVSFLWNKFSKDPASVSIDVTAGDITRSLTKAVVSGENQNNPDLVFNCNFGVKNNTTLKIFNQQTTTALQIGPIAITPYLFYTVKDTLIDITNVATFTNDKLIDNRDDKTAIAYSIVGENDGVASINAATGEVTGLKAGKVTVQAAWGDVTTTYTLTIHQKIDDGIVRILGIGNSFTQDALEAYIMPIILGQGKKAIVGYPYLGGCWQSLHVQNYKNDAKAYNYYKYDAEGKQTSTGKNGASLKQAITDERWDYVFIQSDHDSTGIVQSYIPHLNNLIEIVQTACSNKDVKIGMYMTWAYDSTSTRSAFAWYNNDSQTMYDSIINATQIMMDKVNVKEDMLIPAGTAIQNARTSYIGHTLNRDGYHLNYDYGRYIASLCYYSRIFGEDPNDVVYRPENISDYCADMCRAAAHAAMENPFEVTDLVDYKESTPPAPTGLNQTNGETSKVYKVIKNNQVMFVSGKTMYNIFGQQIQ